MGTRQDGMEELERSLRTLDLAGELARALGGRADATELSWMVANRCRQVTRAGCAVLGLLDGDDLVLVAHSGTGCANGRRVVADRSFAAETLRTRTTTTPDKDEWTDAAGVQEWSWAAVAPMPFDGKTAGCLAVFRDADDPVLPHDAFDAFEARLLETLAATASVALATVRQASHDSVRRRVEAIERERLRWAAELHDGALQQLVGIRMLVTAARKDSDGSPASATLEHAGELIGDAVSGLRGTVGDIKPGTLAGLGVDDLLEGVCERAEQRYRMTVELVAGELPDALEDDGFSAALHAGCCRLVEQALANAAEHGAATRARVLAAQRGGEIEIVVADNGVGLRDGLPQRLELRGMRSEVELVGGRMKCFSPCGGGTVVQAVIPVESTPSFGILARQMSGDDLLGDRFSSVDGVAPPERRHVS